MATRLYFTNSELAAVRTCEKRWWFGYDQLLAPVRTPRPLTVGGAVHVGIQAIYRQLQRLVLNQPLPERDELVAHAHEAMGKEIQRRVEEARELMQFEGMDEQLDQESIEAGAEAMAALRLFIDHVLPRIHDEYEVVAVEQAFEVPVRPATLNGPAALWLRGRWDAVLRRRSTGRYRVNEHKTSRGYAHEADFRLDTDPQVRAYVYALKHHPLYGPEADDTIVYDVVRKRRPEEPSINKDGSVSVAAVDTLRSIYDAARERAGEPAWLIEARAALDQAEGEVREAARERDRLDAEEPDKRHDTRWVRADAARRRASKHLETSFTRWAELQQKQEARASQLPPVPDRWVWRAEHYVTPAALEEWERGAYWSSRHLRDLRAGRRLPVANGASCSHPALGVCPFRRICVDDRNELRASEYVERTHPHEEAIDAHGRDDEGAVDGGSSEA